MPTNSLVNLPLMRKQLTQDRKLSQFRIGLDQGLIHPLLRWNQGDEESHACAITEPRHQLEVKERKAKALPDSQGIQIESPQPMLRSEHGTERAMVKADEIVLILAENQFGALDMLLQDRRESDTIEHAVAREPAPKPTHQP